MDARQIGSSTVKVMKELVPPVALSSLLPIIQVIITELAYWGKENARNFPASDIKDQTKNQFALIVVMLGLLLFAYATITNIIAAYRDKAFSNLDRRHLLVGFQLLLALVGIGYVCSRFGLDGNRLDASEKNLRAAGDVAAVSTFLNNTAYHTAAHFSRPKRNGDALLLINSSDADQQEETQILLEGSNATGHTTDTTEQMEEGQLPGSSTNPRTVRMRSAGGS